MLGSFLTSWTVAHQVPLAMGFPRQEYWSGLPFPSSVELPHLGLNLHLLDCRQILYCILQLKKKILHEEQFSLKTNENWYKDFYTTKA